MLEEHRGHHRVAVGDAGRRGGDVDIKGSGLGDAPSLDVVAPGAPGAQTGESVPAGSR